MKAIILAAGKGLRLRPITETRPKPLIPILCKPLLQWQLEALAGIDEIDEVIIVVSYLKEKVEQFIRKVNVPFKITLLDQGEELGTGDAVLKAIRKKGIDEKTLIIYGDIFLKDWNKLKQLFLTRKNSIVGVEVDNPSDYGVIIVDENNSFKGIIEKPAIPPSSLINAGIYFLDARDILKHSDIEPSPRGELEFTDILTSMARNGIEIKVYQLNKGEWIDIGKPWHLLDANRMALENISTKIMGSIEPGAHVHGRVFVGEDTIIKSGTYIDGPVYIGKNTVIGPNAYLRPYSVICDGSKIGFSVEVKSSLIMENVHISHLSYVGDSIICEHVNFGAGTITANLRFDDKPVKMYIRGKKESSGRRKLGAIIGAYVKTGINVSFMPGVKIGSHSWIAPGAIVYKDIPPRSFYRWMGIGYIENLKENQKIRDK
ncbi:bifunctional sugar-1-phosphate nucleotidylyltransferase/acetyltransferase [Staphylothermus hellenicus]|uniref:Nucleotidyl transferase n=1 Tax=Staphylothermus hellenicus (strain DSM 12710 / JCM 10830 / BK20S6-10-b1 / P8) TaxID=591019 RepID=D7DAB1_STAHD|nr:bifunctional sugar-1-phosphate nucleotidylyltransferase/acetyltransferase [Staphylothermus hellenicus]ADI32707.1 Nucleotidyl transferase [Staphylothermus hellenicus DSM 12710]